MASGNAAKLYNIYYGEKKEEKKIDVPLDSIPVPPPIPAAVPLVSSGMNEFFSSGTLVWI